jgi:hypothetical protein
MLILYSEILALWYTLLVLNKFYSVKPRPQEIFVNYRAYGHSISETRAYLSYGHSHKLCISLGEVHERNTNIEWLFPSGLLYHLILPSVHRWLKKFQGLPLRKYVGARLGRNLYFLSRNLMLFSKVKIETENVRVAREAAIFNLSYNLKFSSEESENIIRDYEERNFSHESIGYVGIGTTILSMIMNRLPESQINIPAAIRKQFLEVLGSFAKKSPKMQPKLMCLVIGDRGKPWHGDGIQIYRNLVVELCRNPSVLIVVLGDDKDVNLLLSVEPSLQNQLLTTRQFSMESKQVEILALYYSEFTFGDRSGVWSLFSLVGAKGFIFDSLPVGDLFNRCFVTPRHWISSSGSIANMKNHLHLFDRRIRPFNINGSQWSPANCQNFADQQSHFLRIYYQDLSLVDYPVINISPLLDLVQKKGLSRFIIA